MDLEKLKRALKSKYIELKRLREHNKASEKYVDVVFDYPEHKLKAIVSIPFFYRRTGLYIETEEELAKYILTVYGLLQPKTSQEWIKGEKSYWRKECSGRSVTKPFFDKLLNLKWNCIHCELPKNPNWARRIQDIKEMGYTLATNTNMFCTKCNRNSTHIMLLPVPKGNETGYECWSPELKKRIIRLLGAINVYEDRKVINQGNLIPDHKFPEIRWDEKTINEQLETLTDDEITAKFQLLDNQRNLQKREVCRKCFQTKERGIIFGINYFYHGNELWPQNVPQNGTEAEKGCLGCGWYDIKKWRDSLNQAIKTR